MLKKLIFLSFEKMKKQEKVKRGSYRAKLVDWVVNNFCSDNKNPNHSQFSAAQVADIIIEHTRVKLAGKYL